MADYIINVGVEVEDSALNTLETRINSLKEKHIKLGVELGNTKQLTKNAQMAVKTISKATAKAAKNTPVIKGSNLVEQMVDPEKALKSMANTASKLSKYQGKLDLGEVKLSVNQGIMGELDGLLAKLNEIKSTAKNMGSIKLTVGDNIKTKDGKIVVGETTSSSNTARSAGITLRQAQAEIKRNMKTAGTLQEQYVKGLINESTYKQSRNSLYRRNGELAKQIRSNGTAADWATTAADVRQAQAKNQEAYKAMTQSASEYDKVITDLGEKQKTFNKMAQVYNPNNGKPLDKTLGQGYDERLKSFNDTYEQLKKSRDSLATLTGDERDTEQVRFAALRSEANRQARYLGNTNQFFSRTPNRYSRSEYIGTDLDPASDKVRLKMEQMSADLAKGSKYTTEFNAAQGKMYATIDRGSGVFEKYQLAYKNGPGNIDQSLTKVTQSVKPLSSYLSEMGQKFRSLSQYLVSNFGFQALTTGIRSGVESIRELDSAMTELKKTSDGTKQEYRDFTTQARTDAKDIGSTTTQITSSAADWSRLGYSLKDSQTMAKNTGILKNVSEFADINEATDAMVGIMQAYNYKPDDSMKLIDQLNQIGNNFSISTSDLAKGLQISGSALEVGGNNIEQSMALITAYNSSIQDVSQAARAARTVSMRMHGVDAETLSAEGEDIEGLIDTVPKLESEIKSLTAVNGKAGISLTDATGRVKDDFTFLLDLAGRWKEIGQADIEEGTNRQSKILEDLAGEFLPEIYSNIYLRTYLIARAA